MNIRSLFLPLYVCILFFSSFPGFLYPNENKVILKFSNLHTWVKNHSPELKLFRQQSHLEKASGYLDFGLQKTNPELSFSNEFVKKSDLNESEQVLELSKTFEMPWIYNKRKKGWQYLKEILTFSEKNQTLKIMSKVKTGYITLVLLKNRMSEYSRLKLILKDLLTTATKKEKEGFLAPFKLRLIKVAVGNINTRILQLTIELEENENTWKQSMGIKSGRELFLSTNIVYKSLNIGPIAQYEGLFRHTSMYQKWLAKELKLLMQISVEKLRFFPDLTFSGGYKKVSEGFSGYTFGLSFNLPILNSNNAMVRKMELALELHRSQFNWFRKDRARKTHTKHKAVLLYSRLLQEEVEPPLFPSKEIKPILAAFVEGTVSINGLLSALQLYIEGMDQYYSVLTDYYASLFQLEILIGKKLVTFN